MSLLYSLMLGLARSLARMGSLGYIASFVIAASVFLSLFQMQQYQIRTFMRVIYLAMVFYMAFAILYKTGFLNLLERSSQLYGKRKAYTMPLASTKQRKVTNASK
ncbi:hypothetical protein OPIT5_05075 [Opitutaceae bacterium TAV5]|nr:hypothetical protein OPIT5_05075 [Opitutaceae bacterium TAV5]